MVRVSWVMYNVCGSHHNGRSVCVCVQTLITALNGHLSPSHIFRYVFFVLLYTFGAGTTHFGPFTAHNCFYCGHKNDN